MGDNNLADHSLLSVPIRRHVMKKFRGAVVPSTNRFVAILSITFLGFAALLSPASPASAASRGIDASCTFVTTTRLTCDFPVLSATFNAEIHYVTAQCNSTGVAFNLQQLQILAMPPSGSSTTVPYQVAGNRASVAGVANAAAIVDIHVQLNTTSSAVIDLAPAPTGTTSCTASMTATF
jgi:hypothetical protein